MRLDYARPEVRRQALARHIIRGQYFQVQFLRRRLQRVCLLIHQIGELVCGFGEILLRLLVLQLALDIGAHFGKRFGLRGLDLRHSNDVKPKIGFHNIADLAGCSADKPFLRTA